MDQSGTEHPLVSESAGQWVSGSMSRESVSSWVSESMVGKSSGHALLHGLSYCGGSRFLCWFFGLPEVFLCS